MDRIPDFKYFTLVEIKKGIFAAIEKEEAGAGSNAAIVDMGGFSVVFDSFLNIDAAIELKEACVRLTGREAKYLINSHYHLDHIMGNQVFGNDTMIVSSGEARKMIAQTVNEMESKPSPDENAVRELENALKVETDAGEILQLKNELLYTRNLARPGIRLRLPDLTFENDLVLYGSKRVLKISTARKAHSPGDSFAILQDDGVCFTGDLMFNRIHPWLGTGDPDNLVAELGRVYNADIEYFVPGHGDIAYKDDIIIQIEYISEMKKLVKGKLDMKNPTFSVMELPPVYHDWNPLCFSWNTDFLLEKYRR